MLQLHVSYQQVYCPDYGVAYIRDLTVLWMVMASQVDKVIGNLDIDLVILKYSDVSFLVLS